MNRVTNNTGTWRKALPALIQQGNESQMIIDDTVVGVIGPGMMVRGV